MSERGTFVTSYLYDYPNQVAALRKTLPRICRDWGFRELSVDGAESEEKTRTFMGVMHGSYAGEEAWQMEQFIFDDLLPELPDKHGQFSITVTPESEEQTVCFTILDKAVTRYKVGAPEVIS